MISRTVLLDQEAMTRHLFRRYLEENSTRLRMQADTGLGVEAISLCRQHSADLLIMDHCLPDVSSAEVVASIRQEMPGCRILILGCHHEAGLAEAIEAGAHGCVLKVEAMSDLQTAIDVVTMGGRYTSAKAAELMQRPGGASLTPRQLEILALIASGFSTKQVAAKLAISFKTADHHRTRLMRKLGAHDIASLVRFAVRSGVTLTEP